MSGIGFPNNLNPETSKVLDNRCAGSSSETEDIFYTAQGLLRYETDTDNWKYYDNNNNWVNFSTGVTYSAGTGVTIDASNEISIGQSVSTTSNVEFNNVTANVFIGDGSQLTGINEDKIVSLTQGGATTITGTYPNFTITSTDTNTTYTAGTGVTINGSNQISIGQAVGTNNNVQFNNLVFNKATVGGYLRLGNTSKNHNLVFGYSAYNLAGSGTQHLIKTINYNQASDNWNTMQVIIYYSISHNYTFGAPLGIGTAYRDFYFIGTTTSTLGFGSDFLKINVGAMGSTEGANFRLNRISSSQWQLVYINSNSNTTQLSVEVHIQVTNANIF